MTDIQNNSTTPVFTQDANSKKNTKIAIGIIGGLFLAGIILIIVVCAFVSWIFYATSYKN